MFCLRKDGTETHGLPGRNAGYQLGTLSTPDEDLLVHYAYDSAGRMFSVVDSVNTFTYTRVADSDLLASITGPAHSVEYLYEANRDVKTQVKNTKTPGTPAIVSLYVYTYDALGRREDRQQSGTAFSTASIDNFSYNPRSEVVGSVNDVTSAFTFGYAYDNIGNRLHATEDSQTTEYVSNELNQYTQLGVSAPWREPLYDLDGNMTFDGETWTLTWNGENRLIGATDGTVTISFTYDYMGRLVQRDDGTTETFYVYDDWNRIATFTLQSSNFTLQSTNLWGLDLTLTLQGAGGVGGLLREGNAYPLYDANGNIPQKLDDSGATIMALVYDPFGNIISGSLEGVYGFSTKPQDTNLGWYYYGFRYYNPETGRWLNRDPIEEIGGPNLYAMVNNNLINHWDYLGLRERTPYTYRHPRLGLIDVDERGVARIRHYPPYGRQQNVSSSVVTANHEKCPFRCAARCAADFLIGEGAGAVAEEAATRAANRIANQVARQWAARLIPGIGQASTIYSAGVAFICTVSCFETT